MSKLHQLDEEIVNWPDRSKPTVRQLWRAGRIGREARVYADNDPPKASLTIDVGPSGYQTIDITAADWEILQRDV